MQLIPFKLDRLWIDTKLHPDTAIKMLSEKKPNLLFSMYNITNGIKERQDFLQLDEQRDYYLSASITTNTMLCGEALQQFKVLCFRARRKYNSPHYRIRVYLTHNRTGEELFNFETITSSADKVYELAHIINTKINTILWKKD